MKQKHSADRTVRTALDDLDYGTEEPSQYEGRVGRVRMPEGVSRGRLLRDVAATLKARRANLEEEILHLLTLRPGIGVGEMSDALEIPAPTLYRYLAKLKKQGAARQIAKGQWSAK